jgi:hypothetical protein
MPLASMQGKRIAGPSLSQDKSVSGHAKREFARRLRKPGLIKLLKRLKSLRQNTRNVYTVFSCGPIVTRGTFPKPPNVALRVPPGAAGSARHPHTTAGPSSLKALAASEGLGVVPPRFTHLRLRLRLRVAPAPHGPRSFDPSITAFDHNLRSTTCDHLAIGCHCSRDGRRLFGADLNNNRQRRMFERKGPRAGTRLLGA